MRVSKITPQMTRSWNIARRQLTKKGDCGACCESFFFTLHEGSFYKKKLILEYVRYIPGRDIFLTSWYHQRKYYKLMRL